MNIKNLYINGKDLTVNQIEAFISKKYQNIEITKESLNEMSKSFNYVKEIVDLGDPVYGINTGFGALSNKNISRNDDFLEK